ncbi:MAG: GntR family transcriptional regulator [Desulfosarcina sp.]|nr:GntR family transcriptional regulator [Desulfobacterales bacterium]
MDPLDIFKDLKKKIVWLEIQPESTLNLVELAQYYNVSRNPVTLALTRLDAETWVVRHGSHYVVSPLTVARMREITEIRSLLEIQANTWAMHRMTARGCEDLKAIKTEIEQMEEGVSRNRIVELDVRFHQLLYREAQNEQLYRLLDHMLCHYLRFWLASPQGINRQKFFVEILGIIRALEEKDEVRLRAATAEHIQVSMDEIMGRS